ncbi:Rho-binding antiterminator [Psychromonas sp. PT13]|uniref:Rho-binding antiterminator n=1 Tax=Psychromonas sp. PT13 TaxID=3439547 RepID=UPI003EBE0214
MIGCGEYDIIEIVCMYQYPITLTLRSGEIIECVAIDTKRNETHDECVLVNIKNKTQLIILDNIVQLAVNVDNPHIKQVVTFND